MVRNGGPALRSFESGFWRLCVEIFVGGLVRWFDGRGYVDWGRDKAVVGREVFVGVDNKSLVGKEVFVVVDNKSLVGNKRWECHMTLLAQSI